MANSASRQVVKMEGIIEALQGIPRDLKTQILATAVGEAARPIVQSAKRHAESSKLTGALQASLASKVRKYKGDEVAVAVIGPDRSYYRGSGRLKKKDDRRGAEQPARYAHLVEFGHVIAKGGKLRNEYETEVVSYRLANGKLTRRKRVTDRVKKYATGVASGQVAAKPFLRPALAENQGLIESNLLNGIRKGIERTRAKLVRKGVHAQ